MKKVKPIELQQGRVSNEVAKKRKEAEEAVKGNKRIPKTAPPELCEVGAKLYKEIINSLPSGFLTNLDLDTVASCAD